MRVNMKHGEYFSNREYFLSDSALETSDRAVFAFRKPPSQPMPYNRLRFNTKLARARIISEHAIGILKGRFPWLNGINMKMTGYSKSMVRVLTYIDCCIILHNLLITPCNTNEENKWIDEEEFSDIDDNDRVPSAKDIKQPIKRMWPKRQETSQTRTIF